MAENLSPSDIRARRFTTVRRGFDRTEVADFQSLVGDRVETLERELAVFSTRLNQLGITDLVDLKEEIEDVGLEIQTILDAAMAAAEGLRARAAAAAEGRLAEADRAAFSLREDAWVAGTAALEDAAAQASRTLAEAREDSLFIRAQAEQDAKQLVTQARRDADDMLRSSREEGERIVVTARAESESILEEATRAAEKAQERARALENRRAELLNELQEAESAARDAEGPQSVPGTETDGAVRVIGTGIDERTHWPQDDGAVRILPAVAHESAEHEPVDAEAMAAEVAMMRSAVTMPQPPDSSEESPRTDAAEAEQLPKTGETEDIAVAEDSHESRPVSAEETQPDSEEGSGAMEEAAVHAEAPDMPEERPREIPEQKSGLADEAGPTIEPAEETPTPVIEDKVTVVENDPGIDDLFAKLRLSVEDSASFAPQSEASAVAGAGDRSMAKSISDTAEEIEVPAQPAQPPVLHVVPDIEQTGEFDRRDRMLLPIENRGLRGLKRRIVELQNRVLEELRRAPGEWRLGREFVADVMGEELDAVLIDSFQAGHSMAAETMGKAEPQLIGGPRQGAAEMFTADLHRQVQSVIERGDPGSRRIAADVSRVFRNWRTDEAERHVRAAARRAFNDGLLAGYKRLGAEAVEVAEPGRPCGECAAGTGVIWDPAEDPPSGVEVPPAGPRCAGLIVRIPANGSDTHPEQ